MDDTEEFQDQFRQEALERVQGSETLVTQTRVDPDGTVYEWDSEKQAWFPRVDDNFLAMYQMSYGAKPSSTTEEGGGTSLDAEQSSDFYHYFKHFCDWYYSQPVTAAESLPPVSDESESDKRVESQHDTEPASAEANNEQNWQSTVEKDSSEAKETVTKAQSTHKNIAERSDAALSNTGQNDNDNDIVMCDTLEKTEPEQPDSTEKDMEAHDGVEKNDKNLEHSTLVTTDTNTQGSTHSASSNKETPDSTVPPQLDSNPEPTDTAQQEDTTRRQHDEKFWTAFYAWYYAQVPSSAYGASDTPSPAPDVPENIQVEPDTVDEEKAEMDRRIAEEFASDVQQLTDAEIEAAKAAAEKEATSSGGKSAGDKKKRKAGEVTVKVAGKSEDAGWFEAAPEEGTHVYVSGLPSDITEQEFIEMMSKFGLIMMDPLTRKLKVKLYMDEHGQPKGDGRCCYIKRESIELVMKILDGSKLRGHEITAELAEFTLKGDYDPSKKRRKLSNKEKRKIKEGQEKLFEWQLEKPVGYRGKNESVVILKNVFTLAQFEKDPSLIISTKDDVAQESSKYGNVKKVIVYDRNSAGVVQISFKEPEEADCCIEAFHGRFFGGRQITAETWDGRTKYNVKETAEEKQARLQQWEKFLETGGEKDAKGNPKAKRPPAKPGSEEYGSVTDTKAGEKPDSTTAGPSDSSTTSGGDQIHVSDGSNNPTSSTGGGGDVVSSSVQTNNDRSHDDEDQGYQACR